MNKGIWLCSACCSKPWLHYLKNHAFNPQRALSTKSHIFKVSEEVQQAIAEHQPVVALETTIYTHGFPYPENLSLASKLESLVRNNGGVPATIGILDGVARVGLEQDELTRLVSSAGQPETMKISRRDFGFALGSKSAPGKYFNGGTTISGTMILAHMAGIKVFATGGLGGVHRGAEQTMDVSADLTELGRTPVAVISSGCKAFLDLPKTLEVLETQGVAVATFSDGQEGDVDFPAFWTRESGVPSPKTLKDEREAGGIIHAHLSLGLQSGLHFANPIPHEHSLPREVMEASIYEAIEHANVAGAIGAAATPYILNKIKEVTGDRSMKANKALVEANVVRGTKVAKELMRLEMDEIKASNRDTNPVSQVVGPAAINYTTSGISKGLSHSTGNTEHLTKVYGSTNAPIFSQEARPDVFVAGSLAVDLACDYAVQTGGHATDDTPLRPALYTSNPARITQSLGGVGANVARAAHLMGMNVQLCSVVGNDLSGRAALEALSASGMSTAGVTTLSDDGESRTAQYVAVNDSNKDLVMAMADMSILESFSNGDSDTISQTFDTFWRPQLLAAKPTHLILDTNWSPPHLAKWLSLGKEINAHITLEPVSVAKSTRLFHLPSPNNLSVFPNPSIHLVTPNTHELASMHATARERGFFDRQDWWEVVDAFGIPHSGARTQLALATSSELVDQGVPQQSLQLLPFIPCICTKLGAQGALVTQILPTNDERLTSGEYAPYILSRCANGTEDTLSVGGVYMRLFPAVEEVKAEDVVSVNGVGDTFAGTLVTGLAQRGPNARVEELVDLAQRAAVLTLKSKEAVSPGLGTLRMLM